MKDTGSTERRKYKRHPVKNGAFVVMRSHVGEQHGLLIDISRSGLALRYLEHEHPLEQAVTIDIFTRNKGCQISLPGTTITDHKIPPEVLCSLIPMRRRNVQFAELSDNQLKQLEDFLTLATEDPGSGEQGFC